MRRVLVPVKPVPLGPPEVRANDDGALLEAREWQLDPINAVTVEWAVRLCEAGVVGAAGAVAVGGPAADVALRDALARGCSSALRIAPGVAHPDLAGTAALLAAAARREGADVLAFGYESYDASSGALPAATAAALGWPLVSRARAALLDGATLVAIRSRGTGSEALHLPLPAAVSFVEGEIVPRHPRLAAAIAVRRAAIPSVAAEELDGAVRCTDWTAGVRGLDATPVRRPQTQRVDAVAGVRMLAELAGAARAGDGVAPAADGPAPPTRNGAPAAAREPALRSADAAPAAAHRPTLAAARRPAPRTGDADRRPAPVAARYLVVADGLAAADLALAALPDGLEAGDVACLLLGCDPEVVRARPPAERVLVAPGARLDAPAAVVGPRLLELVGADTIVLLDSSQPSRDLAGWLAAAAGAQLAWAVERVEATGRGVRVARIVNGGEARLIQELHGSRVVLLTKTSAPAARGPAAAAVETVSFPARPTAADVRAVPAGDAPQPARLAGSPIVVAVGRGIRGPEHVALFRSLADALGAALGASRAVVDQGWLPFAHQVGQTGSAVAPALYIGFGISGAVQHLVGMRESRTIVAVNTDRHAPLCDVADVVVEADAVEVARALLAEVS